MYINLKGVLSKMYTFSECQNNKTWQSRHLFMCWQNRYHYLFPWEVLTNLWGIKGHIRSGREILSSRDSEVKIFKNIFLPQGWYNWWCIFYRSLIDEIFLKCLFCISCLYCEPFLPAPDRIRQVRKYTPSLLLLHFNSHQVSENIYLQRIRNFYELLQWHIAAKVFNKTF